jgi:hypothetical protein
VDIKFAGPSAQVKVLLPQSELMQVLPQPPNVVQFCLEL